MSAPGSSLSEPRVPAGPDPGPLAHPLAGQAQDRDQAASDPTHESHDGPVTPGWRSVDEGSTPVESLAGSGEDLEPTDADTARHVDIVLLGLMASGKSSVGLVVANELSRPFVDSDSIVSLRTGRVPAELVESTDEHVLHEVEAAAVRQILGARDGVVFAAAASVVETLTSDDLAGAWSVWLETSPEVLAQRAADGRERPLLGTDPRAVLAEQHRRRASRGHRLADLVVETDGASVADVAATICIGWRSWARRPRWRTPNG